VSRSVGLFRPDKIGPSFTPRFHVGRETYLSGVESTKNTPYASRRDCSPTRNESSDNSALRDILELIAKRLDSLENRRYFPSPEFEQNIRAKTDRKISAAAIIVA